MRTRGWRKRVRSLQEPRRVNEAVQPRRFTDHERQRPRSVSGWNKLAKLGDPKNSWARPGLSLHAITDSLDLSPPPLFIVSPVLSLLLPFLRGRFRRSSTIASTFLCLSFFLFLWFMTLNFSFLRLIRRCLPLPRYLLFAGGNILSYSWCL